MSSSHCRDVERPVRKKLPHTIPQWVPEVSFFFITINCEPPGENHLCRAGLGAALLAALAYYHKQLRWHCRVALLMPDHLHAILAFPIDAAMKKVISDWKKYVAREHGVNWQRDFFDHRLRDRHEEEAKINYILMNPVRRGLCDRAEDWAWVYRPQDRPPPHVGW